MKKTFNNQCERVLKYMRDFGITSLDAVKDLGVIYAFAKNKKQMALWLSLGRYKNSLSMV